MTDTTENSATITWTISEDINTFIVEHKKATETVWQSQTVNGTSAVLTGLTHNTTYDVRVKPNCTGAIPQATTFTTLHSSEPAVYPTVVTDSVAGITQTAATLYGTITDAGNQTIISQGFEWKATSDAAFQTVSVTGTAMTHTLTNLAANTGYIFRAFAATADTTVYGTDIAFTTSEGTVITDTCDVPVNLHVSPDGIHNESIEVTWDNQDGVDNWNIRYRPLNGEWTFATSATNSYTITGLTGLTNYEIQVQADCGEGNLSDWSGSITVTTTNIGIGEHLLGNITLYPNPAKEVINVQCTMDNVQWNGANIEVYDIYGKLLQTFMMTSDTAVINVSGLAVGMYFVRVITDMGIIAKPFVKK